MHLFRIPKLRDQLFFYQFFIRYFEDIISNFVFVWCLIYYLTDALRQCVDDFLHLLDNLTDKKVTPTKKQNLSFRKMKILPLSALVRPCPYWVKEIWNPSCFEFFFSWHINNHSTVDVDIDVNVM